MTLSSEAYARESGNYIMPLHMTRVIRGTVPANASGRSGDHRPLADDQAGSVQLTIPTIPGALAFADKEA